jgi:hypothetical protein
MLFYFPYSNCKSIPEIILQVYLHLPIGNSAFQLENRCFRLEFRLLGWKIAVCDWNLDFWAGKMPFATGI